MSPSVERRSAGYTRKRVPQELVVLNGGGGAVVTMESATGAVALNGATDPVATLQTLVPETASVTATASATTAVATGTVQMDATLGRRP